MKNRAAGPIALLVAGMLAAGCGAAKTVAPEKSGGAFSPSSAAVSQAAASYTGQYPYAPGAVKVHLKADPRLNLFDAMPHALLVCVYGLRDPNGFHQMLDEPEGVSRLLECTRFDPAVTSARRISNQPGGEVSETLDRPEGTKYVGLVAGYANLKKENCARLYAVPIVKERIGYSVRKTEKPGNLEIHLRLGPESIEEVR